MTSLRTNRSWRVHPDRLPDADVVLLERRRRRADADHLVSASATLAWSAVKSTLGPGAGKVRRPIRSLAGIERTHFCAESIIVRASLARLAWSMTSRMTRPFSLGSFVVISGSPAGRRGVGRRRRVLDEIDRDDLARLAADLHLEVGRPQAADDDALAIEHGRLDHDDVGLRAEARRRHVRRLRLRGRRLARRRLAGGVWLGGAGRTGRSRRRRAPRHTSRSVGVDHRSAAR